MKKLEIKNDILNDKPSVLLLKLSVPYLISSVMCIFTTSLLNDIYISSCKVIFSILGYISVILNFFVALVSNIVSAGWIKLSREINSKETSIKATMNGIYAVVIFTVIFSLFLIIFNRPILKFTKVPESLFSETRIYFIVYIASYIIAAVGSMLITISNAHSNIITLLISFMLSQCLNTLVGFIILVLLKLDIIGAGLITSATNIFIILFSIVNLRKKRIIKRGVKQDYLPDFKLIGKVLKYSSYLVLHNVICHGSYYIVSIKTNACLPTDYIMLLSVNLPLQGPLSALAISANIFFPVNYLSGKTQRCKSFLNLIVVIGLIYGCVCAFLYAVLGNWYFSNLFEDARIIAYGKSYWVYYGLGFILFPMLVTVRYFLESIGYGRFSFFAGAAEATGNLISAFWLIDALGTTGRSLATTLGYSISGIYLIVIYYSIRKKIWKECDGNAVPMLRSNDTPVL